MLGPVKIINVGCKGVNYCIAGMFGGDKVWRIASSKVIGEKKFGKCIARLIKWTDE